MCFKILHRTFFALVAAALALSLASCSWLYKEDPPKARSLEISDDGTRCLAGALPNIENYFKGQGQADKVEQFWSCGQTALNSFMTSASGKEKNVFEARALANFIQLYFLDPDTKITDEFLHEMMRFKQLFVGGSNDTVTLQELQKTVELFGKFKKLSIDLLPYMKVYLQDWQPTQVQSKDEQEYFEKANLQIQAFTKEFAALIESNNQDYKISDFVVFMKEAEKFWEGKWQFAEQIQSFMPLIKELKVTLSGGDREIVRNNEWKSFLLLGTRGYIQYLRYSYFIKNSQTSSLELTFLTRTVDDVFSMISDLVDLKPDHKVSKDEINKVFTALHDIWPDVNVTPALVDETMKIKQVFFGGGCDDWTHDDFTKLRGKLESLRSILIRLTNHLAIYSLDWNYKNLNDEDKLRIFKKAETELVSLASDLGTLAESSYDLQDLPNLFDAVVANLQINQNWGLHEIIDWSPSVSKEDKLSRYLPLVIRLKNIQFSDKDSILQVSKTQNEFKTFFSTTAQVYSRYLYYKYFVETENSFETNRGLNNLMLLLTDSAQIVSDLMKNKTDRMISNQELLDLLTDAQQAKLFENPFSADSTAKLMNIALSRFLVSNDDRLNGRFNSKGLRLENINFMLNQFAKWKDVEVFSNDLWQSANSPEGLKPSELLRTYAQLQSTQAPSTDIQEFYNVLSGPVPLILSSENKLIVRNVSEEVDSYQRSDLRKLNLYRFILDQVAAAYSGQKMGGNIRIHEDDVKKGFNELLPFAIEAGYLSAATKPTFITARLLELNLFTPRGNGDQYVDILEASDYFTFILSGFKVRDLIKQQMTQTCLDHRGKSEDEVYVVSSCFDKLLTNNFEAYFNHLPELVKYQKRMLKSGDWAEYLLALKKAMVIDTKSGVFLLSDADQMPQLVQFIEGIFKRYDLDHNGRISTDEAVAAFPTFEGFVRKFSPLKSEGNTLAVFTYLMKYGEEPGLFQFGIWAGKGRKNWNLETDRTMLMQIMAMISNKAANQSVSQSTADAAN